MLLLTLIIVSVVLVSFDEKNLTLDEVELKEFADNSTGIFAIMVQNSSGEYVEYSGETFPTDMLFNSSESSCINNSGDTLTDVLSFNHSTGTAIVDIYETSYCYLYFDNPICSEGDNISDCLISTSADAGGSDETLIEHVAGCDNGCAEDGHYRYSGADEDVNNYICFGTSDLETCLADTDTYLFRIIEINPEDGAVKIIKNTSYGEYTWNGTYATQSSSYVYSDTDAITYTPAGSAYQYTNYWAIESTLYSTLAEDLNTTYLDYFENSWQDLILTYDWNLGRSSSTVNPTSTPLSFYNIAITATASFKIGLMNIYDYGYATDNSYWTNAYGVYLYYQSDAYKYNWMYLGTTEWTIENCGYCVPSTVQAVNSNLGTGESYSNSYEVRPTFYIDGYSLTYLTGLGTESNPIVVSY